MKTENLKLSETAGESSGQVHNISTGFLKWLREKCGHKVLKRVTKNARKLDFGGRSKIRREPIFGPITYHLGTPVAQLA